MNRFFLQAAIGTALLALVAGCATVPSADPGDDAAAEDVPTGESSEPATITVTMLPGVLEEIFTPFLNDFTAETGIDVELALLPFEELRSKVLIDLASGGGQYDVALVSEAWMGEFADVLAPLDDRLAAVSADYDLDDIIQASLDGGSYDGVQLGIPWRDAARMLYYNTEHFAAAGLEGPPETWDEVLEYATELTRDGRYGLGIQGATGWDAAIEFMSVLCAYDGEFLNADNTAAAFNSPEGIEALQFYVDLIQEHEVVPPGAVNWNWDPIITGLQQGNLSMSVAYAPYATLMEDEIASKVQGQIAFADAPAKDRSCTVGAAWQLSIPKSAPNPDAAWRFIEYFTTKDTQMGMTRLGNSPVRESVYNDEKLLGERPDFAAASRALANSMRLPSIPETAEAMDIFGTAINNALTGSKSVEAALMEAEQQVNELLDASTDG